MSTLLFATARRALPLMTPNARAEAERILATVDPAHRPTAARQTLAALHAARMQSAARRLHAAIVSALGTARTHTLALLRARTANAAGGAAFDVLFDPEVFGKDLFAKMRAVTETSLEEAGQGLYDELHVPPDDPFTMAPPEAKRFIAERENLLAGVPDEIHGQIGRSLNAGFDAGESLAQLEHRVETAFAGVERGRAQVIAKTETHAAYGHARQEAMQRQGVQRKQWLVSMSPLIKKHRDLHLEMDGQVADIGAKYQYPDGQGDYLDFPGAPGGAPEDVINCSCTSIPFFDEEAPTA